ncbi:MAG: SnoaL-like protein [Gammaproteobacteria bacterium]|nr:SnoaL-like protein [Gammaproteobacteria bacterium]
MLISAVLVIKYFNHVGVAMINTLRQYNGARDAVSGSKFLSLLTVVALLAFQVPQSVYADNVQTTQANLLDRIQIEDLISNYYWDMGAAGRDHLSEYYTEDAILDVNGIIYKGHAGIQSAYTPTGEAGARGRMTMLLNNPRIRVNGATATAETIWTGIMNDTVRLAPRLFEQGREYTELAKKDGRWYFTRRVITSDAGLTEKYDDTYKPR